MFQLRDDLWHEAGQSANGSRNMRFIESKRFGCNTPEVRPPHRHDISTIGTKSRGVRHDIS